MKLSAWIEKKLENPKFRNQYISDIRGEINGLKEIVSVKDGVIRKLKEKYDGAAQSADWWKNKENAIAKCWAENVVENAELESKLKAAVDSLKYISTYVRHTDATVVRLAALAAFAGEALKTIQGKGDEG